MELVAGLLLVKCAVCSYTGYITRLSEKTLSVRSRCNFWRVRAKNRMSHADWSSWHCFVVRETVPRQSTAVDRTRTCGLNASCCRHRQLPRECSQRSAYRRYTSTARCNDGRYDSTWRALVIQQWRDGSARLYHQSPLGIITTSLHVTVKVHHHRIAARPKSPLSPSSLPLRHRHRGATASLSSSLPPPVAVAAASTPVPHPMPIRTSPPHGRYSLLADRA